MLKKYDEFTEPYDQTKEKEHLNGVAAVSNWIYHRRVMEF